MPLKLNNGSLKGAVATVSILALMGVYGFAQQPTVHGIILTEGDTSRSYDTTAKTVAEFLQDENIALGAMDRCSVKVNTTIASGMQITITRVREETLTERRSLPFTTRKRFTDTLRDGQSKVLTVGKNGEDVVVYHAIYKDGKVTEKQVLSKTSTAPTQEVVLVGASGRTVASRGSELRGGGRTITLVATAYSPIGNGPFGMQTATPGVRCRYGVVAVDPSVIPLGTRLYVPGYGNCVAYDKGSAIKGHRIDLFYPTERQASAYGRKRVTVTILGR
jgi:3D (Asp-Asp-Asp) domain-containing protein